MIRSLSLACALLAPAALPAMAQSPFQGPVPDDWARQQMQSFVDVWATDDGVTAESVERFYAPRVSYFGKSMTRAQVLADKRAFIRRWPGRTYRMAPETVSVRCDKAREVCRATGRLDWSRRSDRGRLVKGASRVTFTLTKDSGGRIVKESAVTLRSSSRR